MKQNICNKEYWEQIIELSKEWLSIRKIAEQLNVELWINLNYHNVRKAIKELSWEINKTKDTIKELNEKLEEKNNYEIEDNQYVFYVSVEDKTTWEKFKKRYALDVDFVDDIFNHYSRYWKNLTQQQIIDKFNLKPKVWNLIKGRLWLNKYSHVLSWETLNKSDEEVEEKIIDASINYIDNKKAKFIKTIEKEKDKEFKRMLKILSSKEDMLSHLQTYLKTYKPKNIKLERKKIENNDSIDVWFSDTHLGKKDTQWVINRIEKMTNLLIDRPEKNINLMFLWDIAESLVEWWFHNWQIEEMDWIYWFELMMSIVEVFEAMLIKLYQEWKDVRFIWIGWNHWRNIKEQWDWARTNELIIFELIKKWVKHIWTQVEYMKDSINSIDLWEYHYIIWHWDNNLAQKAKTKPEDVLWKNGNKNKQNILMFWHLHSTYLSETDKATIIGLPWLAWRWVYDKRLDLKSSAWVVIIEKWDDGLPNVLLHRLK